MTQHQSIEQDSTRRYSNQGQQERYGTQPRLASGPDRVKEVDLRIEAPGYGRAPLSTVVSVEALSEIEVGDRPVEANLKIRVPGYGWRAVGVRVSPRDEDGARGQARSVRMRVPGYGGAPMRITFPARAPEQTEPKGQRIGSVE